MFVLGIDVGTQGARAIIVDRTGHLVAEGRSDFPVAALYTDEPGRFEQDPRHWRTALFAAIAVAVSSFKAQGHDAGEIAGISATSTSGTLCLVDASGEPVGPGDDVFGFAFKLCGR